MCKHCAFLNNSFVRYLHELIIIAVLQETIDHNEDLENEITSENESVEIGPEIVWGQHEESEKSPENLQFITALRLTPSMDFKFTWIRSETGFAASNK